MNADMSARAGSSWTCVILSLCSSVFIRVHLWLIFRADLQTEPVLDGLPFGHQPLLYVGVDQARIGRPLQRGQIDRPMAALGERVLLQDVIQNLRTAITRDVF